MTKKEKIISILKKWGWAEIPSKSKKYLTFERTGNENKFFVGKKGALRKGKNISNSISLPTKYLLEKDKNQ